MNIRRAKEKDMNGINKLLCQVLMVHHNGRPDLFKADVKKYTDELHAFKPDFRITSNWMYSSYVPEKPEVGIDFLSGDYHCAVR